MTRKTAASGLNSSLSAPAAASVDEPADDQRTGEGQHRRGRDEHAEAGPTPRGRARAVRRGRATETPDRSAMPSFSPRARHESDDGSSDRSAPSWSRRAWTPRRTCTDRCQTPRRRRCHGNNCVVKDVGAGMAVRDMNHAVLYVRDVARTTAFYTGVLGFRVVRRSPARRSSRRRRRRNDHDLGTSRSGPRRYRPKRAVAPSGCTTSRGRSRHWATWNASPVCCRNARRSSVPAITAPPRACTPRIPTASSSRWSG